MTLRGHGSPVVRSEYLIDRFHVVFESGGGWQCVCSDFVTTGACRHTREAAGRRAAQSQIARDVNSARSDLGRPSGRVSKMQIKAGQVHDQHVKRSVE
jgi:hypothetical protein